jgi:DNA polymerase-3 subunit alpha
LEQILQPFRGGQCPVSIEYLADGAKASLQLGDDWRVKPGDELLIRLRRLLSPEAVMVRYKN